MKINIGDHMKIQCYKHNSKVHRYWNEAVVLDIKDEYIVVGNNRTLVIEADGRTRKTREPAVIYFFKNRWFNVIAQLKKDGISYYCNIATPYIIEENTIKYIDYDLDLRIFPSGEYKILDRMEYKYHKKIMNYSDRLDVAIRNGLDELIYMYTKGSDIFDEQKNLLYNQKYKKIIQEKQKNSKVFD